jgi:NADPH2:quinone reductase
MTEVAETRVLEHNGPTTGDIDKARARADDDVGSFEGAEGLDVVERDMPSPALAARERQQDRPSPAVGQPTPPSAPARRESKTRLARRQRPAKQLGDEEQPSPTGPGEILVRVEACGLNYVDRALATGAMSQPSAHGGPCICGMDAAGTVIASGDRVTRFAVGEEVFGHFLAESWAWVQSPCARTAADGPHVERRPDGLDPLAAVALAEGGLTAKTILRAAEVRPGQTALVIGATSGVGTVLVPLLAEAGAYVIAGATPEDDDYVRSLGAVDTIEYTTASPVADVLAAHPDIDLFVDLVSFSEPYFITAGAPHGTIVSAQPRADEPGIPCIGISAEPGDLAALAQRALDARQPVEIAPISPAPNAAEARQPDRAPVRAAKARPRRLLGAAGKINRNLVKIMRARSLNV